MLIMRKRYFTICIGVILSCALLLTACKSSSQSIVPDYIMKQSKTEKDVYGHSKQVMLENGSPESFARNGVLYFDEGKYIYEGTAEQRKNFTKELQDMTDAIVDTLNYDFSFEEYIPNEPDFIDTVTGVDIPESDAPKQTEAKQEFRQVAIDENYTHIRYMAGTDATELLTTQGNHLVWALLMKQWLSGDTKPIVTITETDMAGNILHQKVIPDTYN